MGFSGGGSNVLKSHTHDGTIVQDGGALNMDNVTQASLTAGDIVYSDGVHLQRLAIGGAGLALTSSGSAPQWSAGAGAPIELVAYTKLVGSNISISHTFSSIPMDDISMLMCVYNVSLSSSNVEVFSRANSISSSTYSYEMLDVDGGTVTGSTGSSTDAWRMAQFNGDRGTGQFYIAAGSGNDTLAISSMGAFNSAFNIISGENSTAAQTALTNVEIRCSGAHTFQAGSTFAVYRLNSS